MGKNITVGRTAPEGPDFYPTPAWATEALLFYESFEGEVWEPACGDGAMAKVLRKAPYPLISVYSSDLHDRGYGVPGIDFLKSELTADNIVTNPPFNLAEDFILRALTLAKKKVAIFSRLALLESARRYKSVFKDRPPTRVLVFTERVTLYPSGLVTAGTSTIAYAWLIWDSAKIGEECTLSWISPGRKPNSTVKRKKPVSGLKLSDLGL